MINKIRLYNTTIQNISIAYSTTFSLSHATGGQTICKWINYELERILNERHCSNRDNTPVRKNEKNHEISVTIAGVTVETRTETGTSRIMSTAGVLKRFDCASRNTKFNNFSAPPIFLYTSKKAETSKNG
jgi:hypothetical protein